MGAANSRVLLLAVSLLLAGSFSQVIAAEPAPIAATEPVQDNHPTLQPATTVYTANVGQLADDSILYYSQSGIAFRESAVSIYTGASSITYTFPGSNAVKPVGKNRTTWNSNFFYGNDPTGWRTNVANYESIVYEDVWDGIDIVYGQNELGAKYDVHVHPGAKPNDIRIQVDGAIDMSVQNDALLTKTSSSTIYDSNLVIFYDSNSNEEVTGEFKLLGDNTYGFQVGEYDQTRTLIIDPVLQCTKWGGPNGTDSKTIDIDSEGNVYISGLTRIGMTTTAGVYDDSYNGNLSDTYVMKMKPDLDELLFATYIGGHRYEYGKVEILDSGRIFIRGQTNSSDFPTTPGAYNEAYNDELDIFLSELTPNGDSLLFSTLIGTSVRDMSYGLYEMANGSILLGGITASSSFPLTGDALQSTYGGGTFDTVLMAFTSDGSELFYSSYFGGDGDETLPSFIESLEGDVYLTTTTSSSNLPTFTSSYQTSMNGVRDGYIARFDLATYSFDKGTYLGGSGDEVIGSLQFHSNGDVYIQGRTQSFDFPTTTGSIDTTHNGNQDFFIVRMDTNLSTVKIGTYIGGDQNEDIGQLAIDSYGNIILGGRTWSTNFPTTTGCYDDSFAGYVDITLSRMSPDLDILINSTYIGGTLGDTIFEVVIDRYDNVYISGVTESRDDFPVTPGAYDVTHNAPGVRGDAYILRFVYPQIPDAPLGFTAEPGNDYVNLSWTTPGWNGNASILSYQIERSTNQLNWTVIANPGSTVLTHNDTTVLNGVQYYYKIKAVNIIGNGMASNNLPAYPQGSPLPPQNFTLDHGDGFIQLRWDAPASDEGATVTSYVIYRSNSWFNLEVHAIVPGSNFAHNDTNVINGEQYIYSIAAQNSNGIGARSGELAATPEDVPSEPRNFTAVGDNKVVHLSWKPPLDNGGRNITEYRIYRGTSPTTLSLLTILGNVTEYNDTAVDNEVTFYYQVSAVNSVGEGARSETVNATPTELYSGPVELTASAGDRYINLSWDNPLDHGSMVGFECNVFRGTDPDDMVFLGSTWNQWYNDTSVENGIEYHYRVDVIKSVGVSAYIIVTTYGLPSEVIGPFANPGEEMIYLQWDPPIDMGGAPDVTYNLYAGRDETDLSLVQTGLSNTYFSYEGLESNTTYYFRISAVNLIGEGVQSKLINATTPRINQLPVPIINYPHDGQRMYGKNISLDATGSYDPDLDVLEYRWYSNKTGYLGSGKNLTVDLLPGEHNITLTVSDGEHEVSAYTHISIIDEEITPPDPDEPNRITTLGFFILILIVLIITLAVISVLIYQKHFLKQKEIDEGIIKQLHLEFYKDKKLKMSNDEIAEKFQKRYEEGEISDVAYETILEILEMDKVKVSEE